MSAGTRLPLAWAQDAARALMAMWRMPVDSCMVVGSVRRGKEDVGDLEFTARMPVDRRHDELFRAISPTIKAEGLFEGTTKTYGKALEGFKPGFKYCRLLMNLDRDGKEFEIPVQIHRYAHDEGNRGWIEIMRTGPEKFGPAFLRRWKEHHGIAAGRQASVDGHLVSSGGRIVAVRTEAIAFELCGMKFIEPQQRDAVCDHLQGHRS
ncbi:MAG: hypothetical protein ACREJD_09475 [Phycisphaerales bacterium]